ncbi:MAG: cobalamin-binding protein [Bryobacterales bacterium]|nr:cobalamin-binding protein [Bryobacterales bacterium]
MLFALALLLAAAPQRIVSTTPSITEILFALGLGGKVVGVTNYCRYPAEARKLPKIGTYIQPDLERITALRPDLVVIQKNPIQLQTKLQRLGLKVLELEYDTVEQTYGAIEQMALTAGVKEKGTALNARLRGELQDIRDKTRTAKVQSMVFIIGRNPGAVEGLIAVGRASYLADLFQIAGGRNAFQDTVASYPKITMEELLSRNPDVIVDMGDMAQTEGVTEAQRKAVIQLWSRHRALKAVRENRVFAVASDAYVVPGPRMVDAARAFARMLHPEVMR